MKQFYKFFILLLSVFLLFMSLTAKIYNVSAEELPSKDWKVWESKSDVPISKEWKIQFSQAVVDRSIRDESIYILDSQANKVDNYIYLDSSGKTIIIEAPDKGYAYDETYTLFISSKIMSRTNKLLTSPVKMSFTTVSAIVPFKPRGDSLNEVVMTDAVTEVDEKGLISREDSSVQLAKVEGEKLTVGDIFFLPPDRENPFGEARKVVSIFSQGNIVNVETSEPGLEEFISDIDISASIPVSAEDTKQNSIGLLKKDEPSPNGTLKYIKTGEDSFKFEFKDYHIAKLDGNLSGSLEFKNARFNLDVKNKEIQRAEFTAKEAFNLNLTSKLSGEKSGKIELEPIPVPYLSIGKGAAKAGVFITPYLTVSATGSISISYEFSQSLNLRMGIVKNKSNKLETINLAKFESGVKEVAIEGEADVLLTANVEVAFQAGQIEFVNVHVALNNNNSLKGKLIDFDINDKIPPSLCYQIEPRADVVADFSADLIIKQYNRNLLNKNVFKTIWANCAYDDIQILPNNNVVKPGGKMNLSVTGRLKEPKQRIKDIIIPNDYLDFSTDNEKDIQISKGGVISVSKNARPGDEVTIYATSRDPFSKDSVIAFKDIYIDGNFVYIPDESLEDSLKEQLNKYRGKITEEDMQSLTELRASNRMGIAAIYNLKGLDFAYNLRRLDIYGLSAPSIDELSNLKKLEYLNVTGQMGTFSSIRNINAMAELKNLKELRISLHPELRDFNALRSLTQLEDLDIIGTPIKDLSVMEGLTGLRSLSLYVSEISDIQPLKNLTNLENLDLGNSDVSDIRALANLTNLKVLSLDHTKVKDVSILLQLPKLQEVNMRNIDVNDESVIVKLREKGVEVDYFLKGEE